MKLNNTVVTEEELKEMVKLYFKLPQAKLSEIRNNNSLYEEYKSLGVDREKYILLCGKYSSIEDAEYETASRILSIDNGWTEGTYIFKVNLMRNLCLDDVIARAFKHILNNEPYTITGAEYKLLINLLESLLEQVRGIDIVFNDSAIQYLKSLIPFEDWGDLDGFSDKSKITSWLKRRIV